MFKDISEVFATARSKFSLLLNEVNDGKELEHQQKLEKIFDFYNADLSKHAADMQKVFEMWDDKASQLQYCNFLLFKLLCKLNVQLAFALDDNLPVEHMKEIVKNTASIVQKNGLHIPELVLPKVYQDEAMVEIACTFALQQYRYKDIVDLVPGDVFLDCGSFIGDTVLWGFQKGAKVYAFEPIKDTFNTLKNNVEINGYSSEHCYNFGVSNKNQILTFKLPKDRANGAFINTDNNTPFQESLNAQDTTVDCPVQCIRLDDWCKAQNIKATFIKMDIEGAELDALHGAAEMIKDNKPKLAICLYHRDEDLWTIPLYIKSLVPEYKFYCRENRHGGEFVLYAAV